MRLPSTEADSIPALDAAQIREVDRLMTASHGIASEQLTVRSLLVPVVPSPRRTTDVVRIAMAKP
jgi:hypothetical protein